MSNTAEITLGGKKLTLTQTTEYPRNGDVLIAVASKGERTFTLKLRIPGWVRGEVVPSTLYRFVDDKTLKYHVKVNGQIVENDELDKGYFNISRHWKKGDVVELHFDMEPRTLRADNNVDADKGKIASERGPLVYCAEASDNDFSVLSVLMNRKPKFTEEWKPDLLYGVTQLKTDVQLLSYDNDGRLQTKDVALTMIPYYAWAHRGSGEMAVWFAQDLSATRPLAATTKTTDAQIAEKNTSGLRIYGK
jgi:DUF1680 family protein